MGAAVGGSGGGAVGVEIPDGGRGAGVGGSGGTDCTIGADRGALLDGKGGAEGGGGATEGGMKNDGGSALEGFRDVGGGGGLGALGGCGGARGGRLDVEFGLLIGLRGGLRRLATRGFVACEGCSSDDSVICELGRREFAFSPVGGFGAVPIGGLGTDFLGVSGSDEWPAPVSIPPSVFFNFGIPPARIPPS